MLRSFRLIGLLAVLSAPLLGACSDDDSTGTNNNTNGNQNQLNCLMQFEASDSGRTCVYVNLSETTRTQCGDIWEDCDASGITTPSLGCVGAPDNPPPNPPSVTLTGFVDVFSAGDDPHGIIIEVYDASDLEGVTRIEGQVQPLGQTTVTLADLEGDIANGVARACFVEKDDVGNNQVECPIPTDDCNPACQDGLGGTEFCYQGQCYEFIRYEGRYAIADIPTHRPLVIRSTGVDGYDDTNWGIMVQVNVYLRTTDYEYNAGEGTYELDVNLISRQDWFKIPSLLGLSAGISDGMGAIAGEVHDCDGVRLTGAQVGLFPQSSYFAYFNGNPLDTVPLTARLPQGTNSLSIYAEFELPPGFIDAEAWGLVGGSPRLLGQHRTFIFADSVTVLSINDGKPQE